MIDGEILKGYWNFGFLVDVFKYGELDDLKGKVVIGYVWYVIVG